MELSVRDGGFREVIVEVGGFQSFFSFLERNNLPMFA